MTTLPLGTIGFVDIIIFVSLYFLLFFISLFLMARKEKSGGRFFGWLLVLILFPFFGAISYLIYYFFNYRRKSVSKIE